MWWLHRMRHRAWRRMRLLRVLLGMLLRRPLLRMLLWYRSWLCRMLLRHRTWLYRMLLGHGLWLYGMSLRYRLCVLLWLLRMLLRRCAWLLGRRMCLCRMLRSGLLVHRSHFVQLTNLGRTRGIVMLDRRPVNG